MAVIGAPMYAASMIDDLRQNDFFSLGDEVVHGLHPCRLIVGFQRFVNAMQPF